MTRFEIITNRSVEQDILDMLELTCPDLCYTVIPEVRGKGRQGRKNGDSIWPEENSIIIIYTDSYHHKRLIRRTLMVIKSNFVREGIKVFEAPVLWVSPSMKEDLEEEAESV